MTVSFRLMLLGGLVLALVLGGLVSQAQALTAEQIMHQSNDRDQGDDFQSAVRLATTDAQGNTETLEVALAAALAPGSAEAGRHRYNLLATVAAPADAAGLAVLVHEQPFPTEDDIWLYLPAVGSSKKIVPENFRTPLFGSEFTFEELIDREPGLDAHELTGEETFEGTAVWVVRSTPLDPEVAGFAYRVTRVAQDTLLQLEMTLYDDFDVAIKRFSTQRVETVDGVPTRILSTAENLETGRTSTFEFLSPAYNAGGLDDGLFDPDRLGQ